MIGRRTGNDEIHESGRAGRTALPQSSGAGPDGPSLDPLPLPDLAELRRVAYRFLAELFLYPRGDRLRSVVEFAREMRKSDDPMRAFAFYGRWEPVLAALEDLWPEGVRPLQGEYLELFTLGADDACFPYESSYVGREGIDTGRVTAEVQRAYTSAGLTLDPQGEVPDHVSVELDFMSFLCGMEGPAWRDQPGDAAGWLEREERFLRDHLLRWLPTFAARVKAKAPDSFYRRLADATYAFAVHDADLIGTLRGLGVSEEGRG